MPQFEGCDTHQDPCVQGEPEILACHPYFLLFLKSTRANVPHSHPREETAGLRGQPQCFVSSVLSPAA